MDRTARCTNVDTNSKRQKSNGACDRELPLVDMYPKKKCSNVGKIIQHLNFLYILKIISPSECKSEVKIEVDFIIVSSCEFWN